jgi:hypothetical protein
MAPSPELPADPPRRAAPLVTSDSPAPLPKHGRRKARTPVPEGARDPAEASAQHEAGDPLVALITTAARDAGPWFALSLLFHVVILAVLGFIVMRRERHPEVLTTISGFNYKDIGPNRRRKSIVPVQVDAVKIEPADGTSRQRPKAKLEKPPVDPDALVRKPSEVNVAGALAARGAGGSSGGGGGGREWLARQGGNEKSESAVSLGLAWLSRMQKPNGSWQLQKKDENKKWDDPGYPDGGELKTDAGATALALLAFQGAGHTHRDGPYAQRLARAIEWLLGMQKKSGVLKGDFYDFEREGDAASFYAHGQATIALCEAYAMTRDERLLQPIRDALAFTYAAQHPVTGGWKYRRHSEGDLSVFGWQIMALQSARMAGLEVPSEVLDKAAGFLDLVQEQDGSRYRYEIKATRSATPAMTAEGLLCRQYLGWPRNHTAMQAGVKYLMEPENLPKWNSGRRSIYQWYYAAQVLHNLQGPEWEEWNLAMQEELVKNQQKGGGKTGGSWHPFQPAGAIDENADKGGRLYITCLALLTLEVYYRHLPLYRDALPDSAGP